MKTLLSSQKSKLILAVALTSILTSSAFAQETFVSYAKIKSNIIQNDRANILKKRDTLAKNIANRDSLYVSNIMNKMREASRGHRIHHIK